MNKLIDIPDDWYIRLKHVIESPKFRELAMFLAKERETKNIYPKREEVFRAFQLTPYSSVRCVLYGMDPYPGLHKGEPVACGLAFAPRNRNYTPPYLRMVYNRIKEDLYPNDLTFPVDLNIEKWAKQGVLLLNTALTVEEGKSGSHLELWKEFTTEVLKALNDGFGTIFLLWGNDAKKFKPLINEKAHYVLEAKHPVSAVYAEVTWECNHFLEVNRILQTLNGDSIEWLELPPGITPSNEIQGLSD